MRRDGRAERREDENEHENELPRPKIRFPQLQHIGDAAHRQIGRRKFGDELAVEGVMALANKHRHNAVAPFLLDRG